MGQALLRTRSCWTTTSILTRVSQSRARPISRLGGRTGPRVPIRSASPPPAPSRQPQSPRSLSPTDAIAGSWRLRKPLWQCATAAGHLRHDGSPRMTTRPLTAVRRGAAVITAALIAAVAGLGFGAPSATAHTSLIASTPEDGATVDEAPSEVVLEFDEAVPPEFTQVVVLDAGDEHHAEGEPEVVGTRVIQAVGSLRPGEYRVSYRIGSSDGHPISGVVTFAVAEQAGGSAAGSAEPTGEPAAPPTEEAAPTPTTEPAAPTPTTEPAAADDGSNVLQWVGGVAAALVVVVGVAAALIVARRPSAGPDDTSGSGP
ncbi:MAG: hypothetical protein GEU93_11540 [Propionibacteriales bacterium]|nr:hypothetical protein [Propionibacteriales bacterium]